MPVVYMSSSLALAALEVLVNLTAIQRRPGELPRLTAVALDVRPELISDAAIGTRQDIAISRANGDAWLRSLSSLALSVPSRVIPLERNVLLNPRHPAMAEVKVVVTEPFVFDDRLSY